MMKTAVRWETVFLKKNVTLLFSSPMLVRTFVSYAFMDADEVHGFSTGNNFRMSTKNL